MPNKVHRKEQYTVYLKTESGMASGCVIGPRHVLTAEHVVADGIIGWHSTFYKQAGTVTAYLKNPELDLAEIITSSETGWNFGAWVNRGKEPDPGDALTIYLLISGYPSVSRGYYVGPWAEGKGEILIDGFAEPGTSGACIMNTDDELVAVSTGMVANERFPMLRSLMTAAPVWGDLNKKLSGRK